MHGAMVLPFTRSNRSTVPIVLWAIVAAAAAACRNTLVTTSHASLVVALLGTNETPAAGVIHHATVTSDTLQDCPNVAFP